MVKTTTALAPWTITLSDAVAATHDRDGGFTLDDHGQSVTSGYAVAAHPDREVILAELSMGDLLEFMIRNADVLTLPGRVLGGWHDPADGRIYLDVSIVLADREAAMALAVDHDELAIFDLAAGQSIKTY
jgi:hypothetical protein